MICVSEQRIPFDPKISSRFWKSSENFQESFDTAKAAPVWRFLICRMIVRKPGDDATRRVCRGGIAVVWFIVPHRISLQGGEVPF